MSAPIGPGDWVECVDVAAFDGLPPRGLVLRAVYQVERLGADPVDEMPILWLKGIRSGDEVSSGAYVAHRFRPIYRPKSDLIEQLKQPAPDVERELLTAD